MIKRRSRSVTQVCAYNHTLHQWQYLHKLGMRRRGQSLSYRHDLVTPLVFQAPLIQSQYPLSSILFSSQTCSSLLKSGLRHPQSLLIYHCCSFALASAQLVSSSTYRPPWTFLHAAPCCRSIHVTSPHSPSDNPSVVYKAL